MSVNPMLNQALSVLLNSQALIMEGRAEQALTGLRQAARAIEEEIIKQTRASRAQLRSVTAHGSLLTAHSACAEKAA